MQNANLALSSAKRKNIARESGTDATEQLLRSQGAASSDLDIAGWLAAARLDCTRQARVLCSGCDTKPQRLGSEAAVSGVRLIGLWTRSGLLQQPLGHARHKLAVGIVHIAGGLGSNKEAKIDLQRTRNRMQETEIFKGAGSHSDPRHCNEETSLVF